MKHKKSDDIVEWDEVFHYLRHGGYEKPQYKYAPADLEGGRVQWERKENILEGMKRGGEYSDRLWEFDSDKYNRLCEKHFGDHGQWFDKRSPVKIQAWLKEYMGYPKLILLYVVKAEKQHNGFPYWIFGYAYSEAVVR